MTKSEKALIFSIIILLFQITRNISIIIYIAVLFTSYAWLYINYIVKNRLKDINEIIRIRPMELVFIISLIWVPCISILNSNSGDFSTAFPRYIVTFPFILFCFLYNDYNINLISKILRSYCYFMALSALSVLVQIGFGSISFFAASSVREGVERYASLAGSLTALGTLGGIALIILMVSKDYLFKKTEKLTLVGIITFGMLISLQKSAIVNIALCFLIFFVISKGNKFLKIIKFLLILLVIFFIFTLNQETMIGSYINKTVSYTFQNNDLGAIGDLLDRIFLYPKIVFEFNKMTIFDFITGIGFNSLSGTMGLPDYPMSHNNYFDLLFSGGIIHLVSYLALLTTIPIKTFRKYLSRFNVTWWETCYSLISVLILINMLIGAGSFYQPVMCVITWVTICSYQRLRHKVCV